MRLFSHRLIGSAVIMSLSIVVAAPDRCMMNKMSSPGMGSSRLVDITRRVQICLNRLFLCSRLLRISAAVVGLTLACSTATATLQIDAPNSAVEGSPFTITVTALAGGSRDKIFNSIIHFTSSDKAAALPPDYRFTSADAGSHIFTNGITLVTPGSQSIQATDTVASSISATAIVTVSADGTVKR